MLQHIAKSRCRNKPCFCALPLEHGVGKERRCVNHTTDPLRRNPGTLQQGPQAFDRSPRRIIGLGWRRLVRTPLYTLRHPTRTSS
jgi:hypothetical protein